MTPLVPPSSPMSPLVPSSSPMPPLVPSSSPMPPLVPSSSPMPPLAPSSSPMPRLGRSGSPSPPLAPSSLALPERPQESALPERFRELALPERPTEHAPSDCPAEGNFPKKNFWGGPVTSAWVAGRRAKATELPDPPEKIRARSPVPPWSPELPDPPRPPQSPDPPWPPESPDPPWSTTLEATCPVSKSLRPPGRPPPLPGVTITARVAPSGRGRLCHGSAYPAPFPITAHALTWFHSSLIEHTCNHLPSPFISSLTSVTHRLILRLQGCKVAALYTGQCPPVCPSILELVSACGNASLQTVDTVHPASRTFFVVSLMLEALPWL